MKAVIYKICCKDNSIKDCYVGQTNNFKKRQKEHRNRICPDDKTCYRHKLSRNQFKFYNFIYNNGIIGILK